MPWHVYPGFLKHDRVENLLKGIILTIYSFDIE